MLFMNNDHLLALQKVFPAAVAADFFAALNQALMFPRTTLRKAVDYTITAADHGKLLFATAAVAFTLPAKQEGLAFRFFQSADANISAVGNTDIITFNNAGASSVAFSTVGNKIGAAFMLECVDIDGAGTLKWVFTQLCKHTLTVA